MNDAKKKKKYNLWMFPVMQSESTKELMHFKVKTFQDEM